MALFKKKKKKKFSIYAGGKEVFRAPLVEISLKEEKIIQKSIEYFDDPEPCYIHRGAVVARIAEELAQEAENHGGKLMRDEIPAMYLELMAYEDIESVEVFEE